MKQQIAEIMTKRLRRVYCDNCGTEDCDDCHRKYMQWTLSQDTAESMAEEILELLGIEPEEPEEDDEDDRDWMDDNLPCGCCACCGCSCDEDDDWGASGD